MKVYAASPFWNDFEVINRKNSVSCFPEDSVFFPDQTEASMAYAQNPSPELAKKIFDENIEHIQACDTLVFWSPDNNDLGTLLEVGAALRMGKQVLRYNYLNETWTEINPADVPASEIPCDAIVRVSSIADALLLGYNYDTKFKIYYELAPGLVDNMMLNMLFTRVEKVGDKYRLFTMDFNEVR